MTWIDRGGFFSTQCRLSQFKGLRVRPRSASSAGERSTRVLHARGLNSRTHFLFFFFETATLDAIHNKLFLQVRRLNGGVQPFRVQGLSFFFFFFFFFFFHLCLSFLSSKSDFWLSCCTISCNIFCKEIFFFLSRLRRYPLEASFFSLIVFDFFAFS